jgi:hypothetical protein
MPMLFFSVFIENDIQMNNFETDDLKGRNKFKQEFGKYYRFTDTDEFDHTDIVMTACTNNIRYNAEIKKRNYDIEEISGSTLLEKIKLDAFKQAYREDNQTCLIYFNYYNNDSWIAYDMTGRIKYNEGINKIYKKDLPSTTSVSGYDKEKEVLYLCFTTNMYVCDKMKYNNKG